MHISMLTAVVVCVLAHSKERCAQEAKKKGGGGARKLPSSSAASAAICILSSLNSVETEKKESEIQQQQQQIRRKSEMNTSLSSSRLIMRTMIQPSHRTVCSVLPEGKTSAKTMGHPVRVANTHRSEINVNSEKKEKKKKKKKEGAREKPSRPREPLRASFLRTPAILFFSCSVSHPSYCTAVVCV
jgi:hypothetical protein